MKNILTLLIICVSTILVGCVNVDFTLDIDKIGNETISVKLLTNDYLGNNIIQEDLLKIKEKYHVDTIEKVSEDSQSGYLITKKLGNIKDGNLLDNEDILDNKFMNISEEKGLIFNTYDMTIKVNDVIFGNMTQKDLNMINFIGKSANMNFHVVTPFKFLESNATDISKNNDGRIEYSWNYTLTNLENIHIKFKAPNIINICIIGGLIVFLIIIGIFIFIRKRKMNNKNQ